MLVKKAAALKYEKESDRAPIVVAKGKGLIAENIIAKAEEAGVSNGNGEFWNGPHRREMQRKSLINATASRWLELSYTLKTANQ